MNTQDKKYNLVKFEDGDFSLDIKVDCEYQTVWLTQNDMAELFNVNRAEISYHVKKVLQDNEFNNSTCTLNAQVGPVCKYDLLTEPVCKSYLHTASDGKTYNVDHYNLAFISLISNRVKSNKFVKFKEWALNVLKNLKQENGEIQSLLVFKHNDISLDVAVSSSEETVWLTTEQMALLFDRDKSVISKHIRNIFIEGELEEKSNVHFLPIANSDKPVQHFSLDVIISVGYRVKSKNGIIFRKWANSVLKEYLLKGYVLNENRTLITDENYVNLINKVDSIDNRLKKVEGSELYYKKEKLIVNGQIFDATAYLEGIVSIANTKILLVDPYVDSKALNIMKYVNGKVNIRIISSNKS